MKPGRELDIQFAETVMGWRRFEGHEIPGSVTSAEVPAGRAHCRRVWAKQNGNGKWTKMACEECGDLPGFSSDLSLAMDGLHAFLSRFRQASYEMGSRGNFHAVRLNSPDLPGPVIADGETGAHALCLALVKAFGLVPETHERQTEREPGDRLLRED